MLTASSPTVTIHTDAAKTIGYGAVYGKQWFAKEWPPEWKNLNIATLELFPILAALYTWEKEAQDGTVHVHTDNKAVVTDSMLKIKSFDNS